MSGVIAVIPPKPKITSDSSLENLIRGRHKRYPGTHQNIKILGTAWYRVPRKFRKLGTDGYRLPAQKKFWVPMGTGQKNSMGTYGYGN